MRRLTTSAGASLAFLSSFAYGFPPHRTFCWVAASVAVCECAVGPRGSERGAVRVLMMLPFLSLLSAHSWKQHRDLSSPIDTGVSKNSLYTRTTNYINAESPHLPKDLDHSLGIAREEVRLKCLSFLFFSNCFLLVFVCNHFSTFLRLSQRRKKCWSGRGSMRTADRKWWR